MKAGRTTLILSTVVAALVAIVALLFKLNDIAIGVLIGWFATGFSLLTIMLLTSALTGAHTPQRGRNWAWLWALVKLPILGGAVMLLASFKSAATWSFLWTLASVYCLLLGTALFGSRTRQGAGLSDTQARTKTEDDSDLP